jgi:hypothetical protein
MAVGVTFPVGSPADGCDVDWRLRRWRGSQGSVFLLLECGNFLLQALDYSLSTVKFLLARGGIGKVYR